MQIVCVELSDPMTFVFDSNKKTVRKHMNNVFIRICAKLQEFLK